MNTFGPWTMAATDEGCAGAAGERQDQLLELPMVPSPVKGRLLPG